MDEITDDNQPACHPVSLTCASCTRAGAGQAIGAEAKLVSRVRAGTAARPAGARGGAGLPVLFTGAAGGLPAAPGAGFPRTRPWPCWGGVR